MYYIAVLALLLFVVFLLFAGRQSASVQRSRKSRTGIWQDTGSNLSILSTAPPQEIPNTNSVHEVRSYHDASVGNYAIDNVVDSSVSVSSVDYGTSYDSGGDLGSGLADAIDGSGSSFGGFDSGSDYGGGGATDGSSS